MTVVPDDVPLCTRFAFRDVHGPLLVVPRKTESVSPSGSAGQEVELTSLATIVSVALWAASYRIGSFLELPG
jgi:hypothetical protein